MIDEFLITINELGSTVLQALKALLYDGVHFLIGVRARWNKAFFRSNLDKSRLKLLFQPGLQRLVIRKDRSHLFYQRIVDFYCPRAHSRLLFAAKIYKKPKSRKSFGLPTFASFPNSGRPIRAGHQ